MKKIVFGLLFLTSIGNAGLITIPDDKATNGQLPASEWNSWKNTVGGEINGNLDSTNIKANGITSSEITAYSVTEVKIATTAVTTDKIKDYNVTTVKIATSAVTPAKVLATNEAPFVMKNVTVSNGITASTATITTVAVTSITATNMIYTTVKTKYLTVPGCAFHKGTIGADVTVSGGGLISASNTAEGDGYAVVNLPQGSSVTAITAYWYRVDLTTGTLSFYRVGAGEGTAEGLSSANSKAETGNTNTTNVNINTSIIDNTNYGYYMLVTLDPASNQGDIIFRAVTVAYTITNVGQ